MNAQRAKLSGPALSKKARLGNDSNPKVLQETINGVDGKSIQPESSRARRREAREPMATEACAPLGRKSEERAAILAEYIFQRYDPSTDHRRGVSNIAAGPLAELAKICSADGCARAEQSHHSHSSAPASVASPLRGYMHEIAKHEDAGKRGPSQQARGDTPRHQTTTTVVLKSLSALVLSASAPSAMVVPTREAGGRDDRLSDNRNRVKPPTPPTPPPPPPPPPTTTTTTTTTPPATSQPQPQPPSGNGGVFASNNYSEIQPPPPPPQLQPQPPPARAAAAAVTVATACVGAVHPMRSGNEGVDPNNVRRTLFDGILKLLGEVVVEHNKEEGGNDDKEPEWMRRKLGEEAKGLLWDVVIDILSDRWSEIRKMAAKHARSLAMAVGPTEARVPYLRIAARCKDVLLHQRSESDRDWTRVHGFLLGMRATIEGAAEGSTRFPKADHSTAGEGEKLAASPLSRGAPTLTRFTDDVVKSCEEKEPRRTFMSENNGGMELPVEISMPCEEDRGPSGSSPSANPLVCASDETPKTNEEQRTVPTPQARPLPPPAPLPPIQSSTETIFSCLSHRQSVVREAAVELLYALARSLGLQTALALYKRTMGDVQHEKDKAENVAMRGRGGGSCGANARRGGLEEAGSRAENRRSCDRVGGLLGLLERIMDVVPPQTVGESWGWMLPLLRSYIGHPEASLRQAAGAVLLRIATAGEAPASSPARVAPRPASTTSNPASRAESPPRVAHHASARIVIWALIRALEEPSDEAERHPRRPQRTANNPRLEHSIVLETGEVGELRRRGLPIEQPEDLHRHSVGMGGVEMLPGMVAKSEELEVALERQGGSEVSDQGPPLSCSGGAPMPSSRSGGCLAAGATARDNYNGCSSSGGGTLKSWEKHEGVLMVCEGVLKRLVEGSTADIVFSGVSSRRVPPAAAVKTQPAVTAARAAADSIAVDHCCEWPLTLVNATPLLGDLLLSLERLAENALFESELGLREQSASYEAGDDGKNGCFTGVANLAPGALPGGSLELWRAGSQILPSIARAMVWWNPAAISGACERAVQTKAGGDLAGRTSPSLLLLRRRTRLSVACELLRASVRYARHLAETLADQAAGGVNHVSSQPHRGSGSNDTLKVLQAGTAEVVGVTPGALAASAASPCPQEPPGGSTVWAAGSVAVSVTNRERWGGGTEGIADSGVGGQGFSRLPVATTSSSVGSTASEKAAVVHKHAAVTVAQIVCDTLALCCEAPPLLARALAGVAAEEEPPETNGECTPHQSTARPIEASNRAKSSGGGGAGLLTPQWVFTAVVEAIILAGSFHATTVLLPVSKTPSSNDYPRGGDAERRLDSSPTSTDDVETAGEKGTPLPDPHVTVPQHPFTKQVAVHSIVERQLHLLHQAVFPTLTAGGRAATEKQLTPMRGEGRPRTAAAAAAVAGECRLKSDVPKGQALSGGEVSAGAETSDNSGGGCRDAEEGRLPDDSGKNDPVPTKFAIPFSWGSLPLVRVPSFAGRMGSSKTPRLSYRGGKDTGVAAVGESGESSVTRPSETARKAAQLDRLLSARVVRALPGYVSSLPPQRGILIVPTLLRWLEASDHKLRWISVTPLEAHELLLAAISIALQDARVVDERDEDESHPPWESSLRPLGRSSPAPAGSGAPSVSENSSASATRQQEQHRQQPQQQKKQQQHAKEVVMCDTVETLSRVFGSPARLTGGSSLFCQMCEIARGAVDILAQLRAVGAARRQHCCLQSVDQYHGFPTDELHGNYGSSSQNRENCRDEDQGDPHCGGECVRWCSEERCSDVPPRLHASFRATGSSEIRPEEERHADAPASPVQDETMENAASSLLRAVAEHLVRWYKVGVVDKQSDSGTGGSRSGCCVQTKEASSPLLVSTASGHQPTTVDREGCEGRERATSGSSGNNSGGGSNWDDWDDDDDSSDEGTMGETMRGEGGRGMDVRDKPNLKVGGVGYSSAAIDAADHAVLRSTAALMKSVAAFMAMMESTTSRNPARSPGAMARAERSSSIPKPKPSPSRPHSKDQRSGSLLPPTSYRECTCEEAKCIATNVVPPGRGVVGASSSSSSSSSVVVAEETSHRPEKATFDGNGTALHHLEERFLGVLPAEHRQALLIAWRLLF